MKNQRGHISIEIFVLLVGVVGILFLYWVYIEKGEKTNNDVLKLQAIVRLERAKNRFQEGSSLQEIKEFNKIEDRDRFTKLLPYLKVRDEVSFVKEFGLKKIRVNSLGSPSDVE